MKYDIYPSSLSEDKVELTSKSSKDSLLEQTLEELALAIKEDSLVSEDDESSQSRKERLLALQRALNNDKKEEEKEQEDTDTSFGGSSSQDSADPLESLKNELTSPKDLVDYLDKFIIGQTKAKKTLAVAVYNHFKRISSPLKTGKSNILLVGPSGSGKTYLIQKLAEKLKVPVSFGNATSLTSAGYVGEDINSLLTQLYIKADKDLELAQRGIVFIDEFDKIAAKGSSGPDVGGLGVQQGILKMLEGDLVSLDNQKNAMVSGLSNVMMDTSNILFICAGAFFRIEQIIAMRTKQPVKNKGRRIGFADGEDAKVAQKPATLQDILPEDIIKYGFLPEVLGRLPIIVSLNDLTKEDLVKIMTKTKNNIFEEVSHRFKDIGIDLIISRESLEQIADIALQKKLGARGLRSILEGFLLDAMYFYASCDEETKPQGLVLVPVPGTDDSILPLPLNKDVDVESLVNDYQKDLEALAEAVRLTPLEDKNKDKNKEQDEDKEKVASSTTEAEEDSSKAKHSKKAKAKKIKLKAEVSLADINKELLFAYFEEAHNLNLIDNLEEQEQASEKVTKFLAELEEKLPENILESSKEASAKDKKSSKAKGKSSVAKSTTKKTVSKKASTKRSK